MKILLADDEREILDLYGEMLEYCGCEVTTAPDGQDALDRFSEGDCDLVVMDLHMPRMNGFESIAAMQKSKRNVPVVVVTGHYSEGVVSDRIRSRGLDVAETLRKPVTFTTLWQTIHALQPGGAPPRLN